MKTENIAPSELIAGDSQTLSRGMLELFTSDARKAFCSNKRFCVAISPQSPARFFELLASDSRAKALPWNRIHLFWVDKCCGPPDFKDTNYNISAHNFISRLGLPTRNVHRICSQCRNCELVASGYEQTIYKIVGHNKNNVPRFDLIMLVMGADGHVASLFPDTYTFFDTKDLVRVSYFMDGRQTRITLTNAVLRAAGHLAVLVSGKKTAIILRKVLTGDTDRVRYPIYAIWPIFSRVTWLIDQTAAKTLLPACSHNGCQGLCDLPKITKRYKG